jgi:hypothetical protein
MEVIMHWVPIAVQKSWGVFFALLMTLSSCCGWGNSYSSNSASTSADQVVSQACTVITEREDVPVRVGPGEARAVRQYLPANEEIEVIGRATADDGSAWWQVALEGVDQAWVSAADVTSAGACDGVQAVSAPPVILAATDEPGEETGGASWGACGSCADCGADPSQCVLSPEGECLWDPAGCGGIGPTPSLDCVPDGEMYCTYTYTITCSPYQTRHCYDSCGTLISTDCVASTGP